MLDTVGTGKITSKRTTSTKHSPSFTWSIADRQALSLLEQVSPYLRTYKTKRVQLILENYVNLTPRNGKYTPELRTAREEFLQTVMAIKP